jgi:hypothetical protein
MALGERIVARNQLNLWVDATNSPSSIVLDPSPELEGSTCEYQDASGKVASVSANESELCRTRHFEKSFVSLSDGSGMGNSRVDEIEGSVVITLPGTPVSASRTALVDPHTEQFRRKSDSRTVDRRMHRTSFINARGPLQCPDADKSD